MIRLPYFLTSKNKYWCGLLGFLYCLVVYQLTNHHNIARLPAMLEFTAIDRAVPFIPYTVLVYVTLHLVFIVTYVFSQDMDNLSRYFYGFIFQQTVAVLIFWFWPTTYPRDLFPIDHSQLDSFTFAVFSGLRSIDAPTNCLPSLHVSSVFLAALVFRHEQTEKFKFMITWAVLISISTITTKQHYIVDVIGGIALTCFTYWCFFLNKLVHFTRSDSKALQNVRTEA